MHAQRARQRQQRAGDVGRHLVAVHALRHRRSLAPASLPRSRPAARRTRDGPCAGSARARFGDHRRDARSPSRPAAGHGKFVLIFVHGLGHLIGDHQHSLVPLQLLGAVFDHRRAAFGDALGRERQQRRNSGMIARPSIADGWRRSDGCGPGGRSAGHWPRGDVVGHFEEVEHPPQVPGEIAHGPGDGEHAPLDDADGEAP